MSEPVAVIQVVSLLESAWNPVNVVKPVILDVHSFASQRVDLTVADVALVRLVTETERQRGKWEYRDVEVDIAIDLVTAVSLQRLHDLKAEVRRICYANKHNISGFQSIIFVSFQETMEQTIAQFQGTCAVQVTARGLIAVPS